MHAVDHSKVGLRVNMLVTRVTEVGDGGVPVEPRIFGSVQPGGFRVRPEVPKLKMQVLAELGWIIDTPKLTYLSCKCVCSFWVCGAGTNSAARFQFRRTLNVKSLATWFHEDQDTGEAGCYPSCLYLLS